MNGSANKTTSISALSTGGAGYNYEAKVQAIYLLQLITGAQTKHGCLTMMQFQTASLGIKTDDFMCVYSNHGRTHRVFTECKRNVSATAGDKEFASAISNAWTDYGASLPYTASAFDPNSDHLALIYDGGASRSNMTAFRGLLNLARDTNAADNFARKCSAGKYRTVLSAIAEIVSKAGGYNLTDEQLWKFLRVLRCSSRQFDDDLSLDHDEALASLVRHGADGDSANVVWRALVQQAHDLNERGATVDQTNLHSVIDLSLLHTFGRGVPATAVPRVPSFPWGAELWAVLELRSHHAQAENTAQDDAETILRHLRAARIASRLAPEHVGQNFDTLATTIAYQFDAVRGGFDDKATLALFVMLNVPDKAVQCKLADWASRVASERPDTRYQDVKQALNGIYAHYHGTSVVPAPQQLEQRQQYEQVEQRYYRGLRRSCMRLFMSHMAKVAWTGIEEESSLLNERFNEMRLAIGDNYPSYRHPTRDTAAWPCTNGVATFEVLIRAVRCGCVGELLEKYSICTSEPSFERLLNVHAELSAHVALKIRCISDDDVYILHELEQLIDNAVAGRATNLVKGQLVVLPVQRNIPLNGDDLINLPFSNISLASECESQVRSEHEDLYDSDPKQPYCTHSASVLTERTIYADTILAMTLRTILFANSAREAKIANQHGIGVSQVALTPRLYEP